MRSELVTAAMILAVVVALTALVRYAYGEDKLLCHLEPLNASWHFRTQIYPQPDVKCWYNGPRMLSRDRLYWAEAPSKPVPNVIWQEEYRWRDPQGWSHQ